MEIEKTLQELDQMFATHQIGQAERFLKRKIAEVKAENDYDSLITLLNEMIGLLRDISHYDECCSYCRELTELLDSRNLQGTIPYATSMLNVANAYRAAGKLQESLALYRYVQKIYEEQLSPEDFRFASLNNNLSLLYQEMGDFAAACECLKRALLIARAYKDARIEVAVTHSNLAMSLLRLGLFQEAMENLEAAFAIFEADEEKDFHYSAALSAMGEAQYMAGNLAESAKYYEMALHEIEKNTGKSQAYEIVKQNLDAVRSQMRQMPAAVAHFDSGMALCEAFYKEYGEPMIREKFPEYQGSIAAGLVGEGSECLGFDDETSRDHDFGPGFCLWLTDPVFDEIGEALQKEYDKLPTTYMGVTRYVSAKAPKRVGVFRIGEFYERLIGMKDVPATQNQWLYLEDYQLLSATNGKVFRDDLGEFTRIRRGLSAHYPEEVRVKKIAREAALMAQSGQYNYGRMLGRGDKVAAQVALAEFEKHTMQMVYLLNRRYAPFYKWMHRGLENLPILPVIGDILNAIADMMVDDERIPQIIEIIVAHIIDEMKKQSLTAGEDNYLDHHTDNILKSIGQKDHEEKTVKDRLIQKLVLLEWHAFDKTENRGGRADCQDDWNTFSIMRKSQYMTWSIPMLQSFIDDFERANERGWNLITEKYARMMESTAPEEYEQIKDSLPEIPADKKQIIEEIVKIQVGFMEECAEKYPKAASNARSIHTSEDSLWNTSYETYLRGELSTYSDRTLELYGRFITELCRQGKNLAVMTLSNTAVLYGYESLEDLENRL